MRYFFVFFASLFMSMPFLGYSKLSTPFVEYGPWWEEKALRDWLHFGENLSKVYELELLSVGCGRMLDSKGYIPWCYKFISRKPTQISDARLMVVSLYNQCWKHVSQSKHYTVYIIAHNKNYSYEKRELNPSMIGFKIGYWDKDTNRRLAPYLAEVIFQKDTIFYYYADPITQKLIDPPVTETLQEATLKVEEGKYA